MSINKIVRHTIAIFPSATRFTIQRDCKKFIFNKKWGRVLEVGAKTSPLKNKIYCKSYKCLDIEKRKGVDYVEDIHSTSLRSSQFDTVFAMEVLEHLYNPQFAAEEIRRLLVPGGTLIATTRFIYPYHGEPYDYFRFTKFGLAHIFKSYKKVEIISHGSWFLGVWELFTNSILFWPLKLFNPLVSLLDNKNTRTPLGFFIIAKK